MLQRGAFHLIPLYYLTRLSDLGREAIDHSCSFRFYDHVYRNTPSGLGPLGRLVDAHLLSQPAMQGLRQRDEQTRHVIQEALETHPAEARPLRVLAVPCGIPRAVVDLVRIIQRDAPSLLPRLEYHGMDLDARALTTASRLLSPWGLASAHFHLGDALSRRDYPDTTFHLVISTSLVDFLRDEELTRLLASIYEVLEPGGCLFTCAATRRCPPNLLSRVTTPPLVYRTAGHIEHCASHLPWRTLVLSPDDGCRQVFVSAVK
jgi:SAM-dependent methyltransferase